MDRQSGAYSRVPGFKFQFACLALICGALLFAIGCGAGAGASDPEVRMQETNVSGTNNPLVAQYSVTTTGAASVSVQFGPTTSYGFQTSAQSTPAGGGTVNILVAGMKQNTQYHMRAVFTSGSGQILSQDQDRTFQAGAIPAPLIPQMQLNIQPGQKPTPGIQLVSLISEPFALNPTGDIVWFYNPPAGQVPSLIKLLPNGHMLMILAYVGAPPSSAIREVDLAGNVIRELGLSDLSTKLRNAGYNLQLVSIDHDVLLLPNGHLLFIVSDTRVFTDLPGYPGQTTVTGNAVIDVDQNFNPKWVWDAFDHLDVNRHPIYFPDWTHANALFYSPSDGNFLFSLRHQHWVLKIDYNHGSGSGDIIWKLGYQGDFTLLNSNSPADWFYAQHDPNIVSSNTTGDFKLALFDNGDFRVLDDNGDTCFPMGQPPCYTTEAVFDVNESNKTAQREWSNQTPYSWWGGSVQLLHDSNILYTESAPDDLDGTSSRITEVTQQNPATTVWQLTFHDQSVYRGMHLPSLYPGVQW